MRVSSGSLIFEARDGRTYFSINDRKGAFEDNEGAFEFEVEMR